MFTGSGQGYADWAAGVLYWKQAEAGSCREAGDPIEERKVNPIEEKSFFSKLGDVLKSVALGLGDGVVKVLVALALCFLAAMILFR